MKCNAFRQEWEPGFPDAHAARCGDCREWLATQRDLAPSLARLRARVDAAEPASREGELRSAFRAANGTVSLRPRFGFFLGWAAAAGFVAFLAVVVRLSSPLATRQQAQARPLAPAATSSSAKARPSSEPTKPARRTPARTPPASPAQAESLPVAPPAMDAPEPAAPSAHEAAEVVVAESDPVDDERSRTEQSFYPLVPGRETSAIESGQIVRVQLRPDVLSAAGLPSRTPGSAPVEAEVLMGPDGVAVGIRLPRPKR